MKGLDNPTYLTLLLISNLVGGLLILAAAKWPRIGRILYSLLFLWASITNWTTAHSRPELYLEYADLSFVPLYQQFIEGWFSRHIVASVGFVAGCQFIISIGLLLRGTVLRFCLVGGIVFLLAIVPLGVGSGFPSSLLMATGLYLLWRKSPNNYVWKKR